MYKSKGIHGYDKVSGYTIRQIEDVLSYTSSWEDWKNNIKNRYNNATEHIWINFLKRMNKVKLFMLVTVIGGLLTGCCSGQDCNLKLCKIFVTVYLVNETSGVVKSYARTFNYEIQPGQTVIHKESRIVESKKKPTAETYYPFATDYLFLYSRSKCEIGLRDIENYENRKEVSPLVFELTFRFTEERKAKAETCHNVIINDPKNPFNQ